MDLFSCATSAALNCLIMICIFHIDITLYLTTLFACF
jgi:hypothetical protein